MRLRVASSVALLVAVAALTGCGAGGDTLTGEATTPAPTSSAPWRVIADQPVARAGNTPAYVHAASADGLLVTAPTIHESGNRPASNVVARVPLGGGGASGVLPRAVVGVIRQPHGQDRVISLLASSDGVAERLAVSVLPSDGLRLSRTTPLATSLPSIDSAAFAQNTSGDCVLAWSESRTGTGDDPASDDVSRIRVVTGKWGVFSAPRTLHETRGGGFGAVAASVNARGQAVVASDVIGVSAWIGNARNGRFGSPVTARAPALVGPLRVAITDLGRTVMAWRDSNGDAMDPHGPVRVHGVTIAPGARHASPIQQVDRGPEYYPSLSGLDLLATPGDRVTLAFSALRKDPGSDDFREAAFAATTDGSGRFGLRQELAHHGSVGGLAVGADGTAIVTLIQTPASEWSPAVLQARVRAPGAAQFGPAEPVGELTTYVDTQPVTSEPRYGVGEPPPDAPIPAIDPTTGRPVIAYTTAARGSQAGRVVVIARDRPCPRKHCAFVGHRSGSGTRSSP